MRILITGVTGFAGGHLAETMLRRGQTDVFGTSRKGRWPAQWRHLASKIDMRACDLCDRAQLEGLIREVRPEQIYHLAGYAHVGESFKEADAAWAGNFTATRRLYEAAENCGGRVRIVSVGSGLVYGEAGEHAPDETESLRPSSPYAVSKAAADLLSYQFAGRLDLVRVRPFNHIGPRQSPEYAVAHFARQIAAIELGRQAPLLETGNLAPRRDLTDVRDMVRAYMELMERGRPGQMYNCGTGETHSMAEVVERLLAMTASKIEVRQTGDRMRSAETNVLRANASKLRRETGWAPRYTFEQTLADTLAYFRDAVVHSVSPDFNSACDGARDQSGSGREPGLGIRDHHGEKS
jgi:GDP-4-dehydro-6-deoxy-D-mannose reductase